MLTFKPHWQHYNVTVPLLRETFYLLVIEVYIFLCYLSSWFQRTLLFVKEGITHKCYKLIIVLNIIYIVRDDIENDAIINFCEPLMCVLSLLCCLFIIHIN